MQPRIKVLTLAVEDLDRALAFYRDGLGLQTEGVIGEEFENGAVVFIPLEGGMILALWPASSLSNEAKVAATKNRLGAITIGHIVPTKADVDALLAQAERAGGTITDPPAERFWGGYSGHFHDPDGHIWEIAWHPEWSPHLPG
jgi:uncharacterized protein